MNRFRKILFWIHLAAGLVAGLIIFVMSFTGTTLAFENELVAWSERDARRIEVPAAVTPIAADTVWQQFRSAQPNVTPTAITVSRDPAEAIAFAIGRDTTHYLNPYTGKVRQPASSAMHDFMHTMESWHRWLGREGNNRDTGKMITGACNLAFVVLAVTGLYLWFPRKWRLKGLKRSLWFVGASAKARDWNWHNVFGFWMLIPITVMAVSGVVISYRWAGDGVYKLLGEEAPVRRGPPAAAEGRPRDSTGPNAGSEGRGQNRQPGRESARPAAALPPPLAAMLSTLTAVAPDWTSITFRLPQTASVKLANSWPRTATTTYTFDSTGTSITKTETFADQSAGRRARGWLRFLHTGQALGWFGQTLGALGCVAGCFLVYTGFALSYRRFFRPKSTTTPV